jgi:hypothetical protein
LENAQLENRIFSVTLDTLREEVNRLRAQASGALAHSDG